VTETGTVGNPKAQVNKLALLSLAAKGIGGAIPIGGTAGNLLQSLGNLVAQVREPINPPTKPATFCKAWELSWVHPLTRTVRAQTPTPPTATNQPSANQQQPINNLLNDLLKPKEKPNNTKK
jgi:hypothetical protein